MSWAEISLSIAREHADIAEAALESKGALAITLLDDADDPVLEPAPGTAPLWPVVEIRGLFSLDVSRDDVLGALTDLPGVTRPDAINWREVADQAWERAWMDRFQPMKFGDNLWIIPSHLPAPDAPGAVLLRLDPGLAFGTGTHPTTALCLEWIDEHDLTGLHVLDYGCGSGVLGIAAALSGAKQVIGVDNDPQALEATGENARRNQVEDRLVVRSPDQDHNLDDEAKIDLVLANILAGPLIELAPRLCSRIRDGGNILLSGILPEQAPLVAAAYESHCTVLHIRESEGWVRIHGVVKMNRPSQAGEKD